jgi:hypothetical protein
MARGRPIKYKKEYAELAYKFALLGLSDKKMAEFFGVSEKKFHDWKIEHPQFLQSLTRGKEIADAEVAKSLYQRAMGYSHPEEKVFQHNGEIIRAETVKHYPPDTGAATLWLKNRQPKIWRDKQEHEHSGKDGGPIQIEGLGLASLLSTDASSS